MICNEDLFEVLQNIYKAMQKDVFDYIAIIAPLVLSTVAIILSLYNSFFSCRRKNIEAKLLWDEVKYRFIVAIRNSGKKTLVINQVKLVAFYNGKEMLELGSKENVWSVNLEKTFIKENEMISFVPTYGSIYDIFAYKGHYFDISNENKNFKVFLVVTDADNHKWQFDTHLTLGDLDCKIDAMSGK